VGGFGTQGMVDKMGFKSLTPRKKILNCCISLTDAFRPSLA